MKKIPQQFWSSLNLKSEKITRDAYLNPSHSGFFPFTSGPYPLMYTNQPWTIRQYAGFSTAEESNRFYLENLAQGQKGLSVAFDLATHRGYDSDHPRVIGDVGAAGVAIDSVEDMKILFNGIPLDQISVSMTMNGAVLPILAMYIVAAQEQGASLKNLSGTIQNDILKEFMVRNTYIYPPEPSLRIIADIFKYTAQNMPKFNSISISGYHMQEAGATPDLELAYTLADGIEYVQTGVAAGLDIDDFASRLSFFWGIGMNYFMEIAKLRAARYLWANIMKSLGAINLKSQMLRTHCQTSGWSLMAKEVENNIMRTAIEAAAAVHGHTQSLHTNAYDEALALPSVESARIARNTQLILQHETDSCYVIDPWNGSRFVEKLTYDLTQKVLVHLDQIDKLGGMAKAISAGIPKREIEKSAALIQAKIDSGEKKIVGHNCFLSNGSQTLSTLKVNQAQVLKSQLKKLSYVKETRDKKKVQQYLNELTSAAKHNNGNLLEIAIKAASARATLGEISDALENIYGRHQSKVEVQQGIYLKEVNSMKENEKNSKNIKKLLQNFLDQEGRAPRILLAKIGQDGHDRGQKVVASALADLGFDVDVGPLFQTPAEVVKQAVENDVHFIGISSLAAAHLTLVPQVKMALKKYKREDIKIIVGGVLAPGDEKKLKKMGVSAVFGPGTNLIVAAKNLIQLMVKLKGSK